MVYEFTFLSKELEFVPNGDGTHRLRVIQAGGPPMEFNCDLEPHLMVRVSLDTSGSTVRQDGVICVQVTELDLRIQGSLRRNPNGPNWTIQVLDRDDCGNPK